MLFTHLSLALFILAMYVSNQANGTNRFASLFCISMSLTSYCCCCYYSILLYLLWSLSFALDASFKHSNTHIYTRIHSSNCTWSYCGTPATQKHPQKHPQIDRIDSNSTSLISSFWEKWKIYKKCMPMCINHSRLHSHFLFIPFPSTLTTIQTKSSFLCVCFFTRVSKQTVNCKLRK